MDNYLKSLDMHFGKLTGVNGVMEKCNEILRFDYDKEDLIAEEIVENSPLIKAIIKRVANKLKGQAAWRELKEENLRKKQKSQRKF